MLTSTFPRAINDPVPAGFVLELSKRLAEAYRVVVVAPHDPGAAYEEYFGPIKVLRFPYFLPTRIQRLCNGQGILPNMRKGVLPRLQVPFLILSEYLFIKKVLRSERPDFVHSHWAIPQGLCAALAKPRGLPHYLTIHSSDLHTLKRFRFGHILMNFILKRVNVTVLVSDYLRSLLREMAMDHSGTMTILPMGVDEVFYGQTNNNGRPKNQLLYIGKLIEIKGVHVLIDAMSSAIVQIPQLKLKIIGDGPQRKWLEKKAERMGLLNKNITFKGQVPHHLLPDQLRHADAVVVPSIVTKHNETEGMPVVILESLAAGCPVLASDVGGLKEIIKYNENGLLFPHSNPDHLASEINYLYKPGVLPELRKGAKASSKKFSWHKIAAQYMEIFESPC